MFLTIETYCSHPVRVLRDAGNGGEVDESRSAILQFYLNEIQLRYLRVSNKFIIFYNLALNSFFLPLRYITGVSILDGLNSSASP